MSRIISYDSWLIRNTLCLLIIFVSVGHGTVNARMSECSEIIDINDSVIYINANSNRNLSEISEIFDCASHAVLIHPLAKNIQINLDETIYFLKQTLDISSIFKRDNLHIRIIGKGHKTILSGVTALSNWKYAVDKGFWGKNSSVMQVSISSKDAKLIRQGITREHGPKLLVAPPELIVDGEIFRLARWPNEDFFKVKEYDKRTLKITSKIEGNAPAYDGQVYVHGFWNYDWADSQSKAKFMVVHNILHIELLEAWPKYGVSTNGRFYLLGSRYFLDKPGEYAIDPEKDILYFIPRNVPKKVEITSVVNGLVSKGLNLVIQNVSVNGVRGTAFVVQGQGIKLLNCGVTNAGGYGIRMEGSDNLIENCHVSQTGSGGIEINGGNRITLERGNINIRGSLIEKFGRIVLSRVPGVRIDGVGNSLTDSKIRKGPHAGVFYFGNDHLISNNDISEIALETGDVGALYTGRDWTGRGHLVSENYIHDIYGVGEHGATAIYVDDQSSGINIVDNIIWNVHRGVLIGGGRDNNVKHNVFLRTNECLKLDARGLTWQSASIEPGGEIWKNLHKVPYDQFVYKSRYPTLVGILNDSPGLPKGNIVKENVGLNCQWIVAPEAIENGTIGPNWVNGDHILKNDTLMKKNVTPSRSDFEIDWPKIKGTSNDKN